MLGNPYLNGDGVSLNYAEAMFWLCLSYSTEGVFWSPSPGELIDDVVSHLVGEDLIGEIVMRVANWMAAHGPSSPSDY